MIEIVLNGKSETINKDTTISGLIDLFGFKTGFMAVAVNGELLLSQRYSQYRLQKGDEVEVLSPMSGG